jgi:hypothetical protein
MPLDPREGARRAAEQANSVSYANCAEMDRIESKILDGSIPIPSHYYGGRPTLADKRRALMLDRPPADSPEPAAEAAPTAVERELAQLLNGLDDDQLGRLGELIADCQFGGYAPDDPEGVDGD